MENNENYIKVRDDNEPVKLLNDADKITLADGFSVSWISNKETNISELRNRIEPWLTALFQSEHLALLTGSGISRAISYIANPNPKKEEKADDSSGSNSEEKPATMDKPVFSVFNECIQKVSFESALAAGRDKGNNEDVFRTSSELIKGLKILLSDKTHCYLTEDEYNTIKENSEKLEQEYLDAIKKFAESILRGERLILNHGEDTEKAMNILVNFLMSFASRNGTRDRLQIFTTNYDRVLEEGADLAGLRLIDRFVGSLNPVFRSSRIDVDMHYNSPGIRGEPRYLEGVAHYTKLHGSVDWIQSGNDIRKIGLSLGAESIDPYLKAPGLFNAEADKLMIFPNAAKDTETAQYPYVDMFRDFAAAICRPNSTIVTYGYSFGDDHINRVIKDMLTIPSTHLLIISFDDPLDRIMSFYKKSGRPSQISLLLGKEFGDITKLTENYLPKSAIDKNSFRLGEILKERYNFVDEKKDKSASKGDEE